LLAQPRNFGIFCLIDRCGSMGFYSDVLISLIKIRVFLFLIFFLVQFTVIGLFAALIILYCKTSNFYWNFRKNIELFVIFEKHRIFLRFSKNIEFFGNFEKHRIFWKFWKNIEFFIGIFEKNNIEYSKPGKTSNFYCFRNLENHTTWLFQQFSTKLILAKLVHRKWILFSLIIG
jgi:hypothetical protein